MSFAEGLSTEKPSLVSFHADWCGTCQTMSPILSALQKEVKGKINYMEIDIDKNPQVAAAFRVRSVPSLILFKNGKPVWRYAGLIQTKEILEIIEQHL